METTRYAVAVRLKEVRYESGDLAVKSGEYGIASIEPEGWVEATCSKHADGVPDATPKDAKLFDSAESAEAFGKRWKGHPWWIQPDGHCVVIPVKPKYVRVLAGYVPAGKTGGAA